MFFYSVLNGFSFKNFSPECYWPADIKKSWGPFICNFYTYLQTFSKGIMQMLLEKQLSIYRISLTYNKFRMSRQTMYN